jgi:hypothetical protein
MRTITVNIYHFAELSAVGKEQAITDFRHSQQEFGQYLYDYGETCKEQIIEAGFEGAEVSYSLSYCQGDGLSFKADSYSKLGDLISKHLPKGKEQTACTIENNLEFTLKGNKGRYSYAAKDQLDLYLDYYSSSNDVPNVEGFVANIREDLEDIYMDLCEKLEKEGYEEIEYQDSEKTIKETIEANEYEFTEDGKLI